MPVTRQTLLEQAAGGIEHAWSELDAIYRPLIQSWLHRYGIRGVDADEITQEVLIVLHRKLREFQHSGNTGAFRKWLRTITTNQIRGYARKNFNKPQVVGGSSFLQQVENIGDENDEMQEVWNREHDQAVIRGLLNYLRKQIDSQTVAIFCRLTLDEIDPAQVANEFGVSVGSVYSSKSRVMRKIRVIGRDLLDSSYFEDRT